MWFDTLQIRVAGLPERLPICTASRPNLLILDIHYSEKLFTKICCVLFWTVSCLLHPLSIHYCFSLVWKLQFYFVLNGTGTIFSGFVVFPSVCFFCPRLSLSANFKFFCRRLLVKAAQSWLWLNTCCVIKAPSFLIIYSFDLLVVMEKT